MQYLSQIDLFLMLSITTILNMISRTNKEGV